MFLILKKKKINCTELMLLRFGRYILPWDRLKYIKQQLYKNRKWFKYSSNDCIQHMFFSIVSFFVNVLNPLITSTSSWLNYIQEEIWTFYQQYTGINDIQYSLLNRVKLHFFCGWLQLCCWCKNWCWYWS